jgi:erythromycin esterase
MNRNFLVTMARSGMGALLLWYAAIGHCGEDAFAKWAASNAVPITTLDFAGNDSEMRPLRSAIGAAHIVAFGEPLHGAHEPLAFRNRLFRFLVEQMGFTAIAVESGFTDLLSERSFIDGADAERLSAQTSEFGQYRENRELAQWMRDYNATASARHRRIHLYGINLAGDARPSAPRRVLDYALAFLSRADPTTAQKIRISMSDSLPSTDDGGYRPLPTATQADFEADIDAIASAMQKSRKILIERTSAEEYQWAVHNLDTGRQLAKCLPLTPPPSAGPSPWVATFECRDAAMAKNAQWALEQEGRQGRLLIFAHNAHVMNWKEEGPRWAEAPNRPSMMGLHLRQVYGKDLYIIAMSTATTTEGLPKAKPMAIDSIDRALADLGRPLLFLDVRSGQKNKEVLAWLSTQRSLNANVYIDFRLTPSAAVDAFAFVKMLSPAIPLSKTAP